MSLNKTQKEISLVKICDGVPVYNHSLNRLTGYLTTIRCLHAIEIDNLYICGGKIKDEIVADEYKLNNRLYNICCRLNVELYKNLPTIEQEEVWSRMIKNGTQ